jgi:hypothetical protein
MCHGGRVRRPHVQVVIGKPTDLPGDLVILPARKASFREPRTVLIETPRGGIPSGSEVALANAYRDALAAANARNAQSIVLPVSLSRGTWPIEDLTRVAMTVLMSTPTSVKEVTVAVPTPAALEAWAEALLRES